MDPAEGPLAAFAHDLRKLRREAGSPPYRELARRAHFSASTLSTAAGGRSVPSLRVVQGFVVACRGDIAEWTSRWHELMRVLERRGAAAGLANVGLEPAPRPPGARPTCEFGGQRAG
ncbi:MAG TPA: helix-turn-helix transcriptional regulator [Streptosporangiaceae bacterium]